MTENPDFWYFLESYKLDVIAQELFIRQLVSPDSKFFYLRFEFSSLLHLVNQVNKIT